MTIAAGLAVASAAFFLSPMGASVPIMVVLGILLIASGFVNLAWPGLVAMEYVQGGLGVLLIISPWVGRYVETDVFGPAWMSWICGTIALVLAALAIRPAMRAHHDAITH
ncbi:SPW repeat domain-containing protein [Agromyces tropicus]|uniref:SPW repeat domain-containing protein n=1 Tax=Agromyces tropicus TaxID=555371 RepID=UPI0031E11ACF